MSVPTIAPDCPGPNDYLHVEPSWFEKTSVGNVVRVESATRGDMTGEILGKEYTVDPNFGRANLRLDFIREGGDRCRVLLARDMDERWPDEVTIEVDDGDEWTEYDQIEGIEVVAEDRHQGGD